MSNNQPQKPNYPPKPVPMPAGAGGAMDYRPPQVRRSEEAARAAQHVLDLENDLSHLTTQLGQLKNMLQLEEERNKVLTADLKSAQLDRDYYQKRATEIMTKLTIAGSIILDAMKEPVEREDPEQRALIKEAAERALRGDLDLRGRPDLTHEPPETGGHS